MSSTAGDSNAIIGKAQTYSYNKMTIKRGNAGKIEAIDLFCGAGGLSYGLRESGVIVKAGIDLDPACEYPYIKNIKAPFFKKNVEDVQGKELAALYSPGAIRLLAGCAPCQPFSTLANGRDTTEDQKWGLLVEFARLVKELKPELVTMENVPRVANHAPYEAFIGTLRTLGYHVDAQSVRCADFGIPQERRRFVLIASRFGQIKLPKPGKSVRTVRDAISHLKPLAAGESDSSDPLHKARSLTPINLARIKASRPGGSWEDWPEDLRSPCHRIPSGSTFRSVYARMSWDSPAPTITTQSFNFGTGRFGHPEQDRAITMREAAILQSFPPKYQFVKDGGKVHMSTIGRLIGNAVPPKLAEVIGLNFLQHIKEFKSGFVQIKN